MKILIPKRVLGTFGKGRIDYQGYISKQIMMRVRDRDRGEKPAVEAIKSEA